MKLSRLKNIDWVWIFFVVTFLLWAVSSYFCMQSCEEFVRGKSIGEVIGEQVGEFEKARDKKRRE